MVTDPIIETSIPDNGETHTITRKGVVWNDLAFARRVGAEDFWLSNTNSSIPRDLTEKVHLQRARVANIYSRSGSGSSDIVNVDKQLLSPYKGGTKLYYQVYEYVSITDPVNNTRRVVPIPAFRGITIPDDPGITMEIARKVINRLQEYDFVFDADLGSFTDNLEAAVRGSLAPIIL